MMKNNTILMLLLLVLLSCTHSTFGLSLNSTSDNPALSSITTMKAIVEISSSSSNDFVLTTTTTTNAPMNSESNSPSTTTTITSTEPEQGLSTTTTQNPSLLPTPSHLRNQTGTTPLRSPCNHTSQCLGPFTECRLQMCKCQLGYVPRTDNAEMCGEASKYLNNSSNTPQTDPTMIGVVIGLVLMSVTLCVVMRLFAKARFQEQRSIFNTPQPRLMNASLFDHQKNKRKQRPRRGSQTSVNIEEGEEDVVSNKRKKFRNKEMGMMSTETEVSEGQGQVRAGSSKGKGDGNV